MGRTSEGWPCINCFADILHPPSVEKPIHKTSKCKEVRHLRNYHLFNFHFLMMILCYRFRLVMVNTFVIDITILYYRLVSTLSLSESVKSNMAEAVHWYTVNVIAMELMSRNDIVAVYRDLLGNRALFILLVRSYCESCVFFRSDWKIQQSTSLDPTYQLARAAAHSRTLVHFYGWVRCSCSLPSCSLRIPGI